MKLNKLALLCAVACAGFVGQASAQVAGTAATVVNEANTNNRIIYISGASAVQGGLEQIADELFQAGSFYYFTPAASTGRTADDYRAYAGRLKNNANGWLAGQAVILINRARGGSVWGVNPVARREAIESLVVTTATCTTGGGTSASPYACTTLENRVPDAGISDVAPKLFVSPINTEGEPSDPALSASELASLTASPLYGLAFGIPLSNNLPLFKLNKAAVSSIMAGNVGTWNQVNAALPADDILLCRRVNGSGSQAVVNMYFGDAPCNGSLSNSPADRESGAAWDFVNTFVVEGGTGALNVVENSSSGNVRTCLNNAVIASNAPFDANAVAPTFQVVNGVGSWVGSTAGYTVYTTADRAGLPVGVAFRNGVAHKAIGVLSMDSLSNSSVAATGFSFRALDGAGRLTPAGAIEAGSTGKLPTKADYMDGTWDMQGWISLNVPSATTGNKLAVINQFKTAAKLPSVLAAQTKLALVAGALPGTADPTNTGNVLKAGYLNGDQCGPLNRR